MYHHDVSRALSPAAGTHGASDPVFRRVLQKAGEAVKSLEAENLPLISLCQQTADIAAIERVAVDISSRFSTVIVFGMGGSSLSGKMLTALALNPYTQTCGTVRLLFCENIDPYSMDALLAATDYSSTLFLMISKSGGTGETLSHMSILWQAAEKKLGTTASHHFTVITEPKENPLRRFAATRNIRLLDHPSDIGGRYAALTLVGLLPAAIAGLDIHALRNGAADVLKLLFAGGGDSSPAQGAALSHVLAEQGKNISVMLPYCDRLFPFAWWHRQIWAESLGKSGKGITPAPALGTVDQHSQLQLYLDGPRDKFFTLLALQHEEKGPAIPAIGDKALSYLDGHRIGDLMGAHQHATIETFTQKQCPLRVISLAALNEETLGALTMHFMLETILTGRLMGIDPFDQPAVEVGKKLAISRLSGK